VDDDCEFPIPLETPYKETIEFWLALLIEDYATDVHLLLSHVRILHVGDMVLCVTFTPVRFVDPLGLWGKDIHEQMTRYVIARFAEENPHMSEMFSTHIDFIVAGNRAVDYHPYRAMNFTSRSAQSRHFNRNTDGTDSRVQWGEHYLNRAVNTWSTAEYLFGRRWINSTQKYELRVQSLTYLGRGLHSVQDIEAHGNIGVGALIAVHGLPGSALDADNPNLDWRNDDRQRLVPSTDRVRYNISREDTRVFLERFYRGIGAFR